MNHDEIKTLAHKALDEIKAANLGEALNYFENITKKIGKGEYLSVIFMSQYNGLNKNLTIGVITQDEYSVGVNRIQKNLIDLLSHIENGNFSVLEAPDKNNLEEIINRIKIEVEKRWLDNQKDNVYYSIFGSAHCEKIRKTIDRYLSGMPENLLNEEEDFCLNAAFWIFSAGVSKVRINSLEEKVDYTKLIKDIDKNAFDFLSELSELEILKQEEEEVIKSILEYSKPEELIRFPENKSYIYSEHIQYNVFLLSTCFLLVDILHFDKIEPKDDFSVIGLPAEIQFRWLKSKLFLRDADFGKRIGTLHIKLKCPFNTEDDQEQKYYYALEKYFKSWFNAKMHAYRSATYRQLCLDHSLIGKIEKLLFSEINIELDVNAKIKGVEIIRLISKIVFHERASAGELGDKVIETINYIFRENKPNADNSTKWDLLEKFDKYVLSPAIDERPCHIILHKINNLIRYYNNEADNFLNADEKTEKFLNDIEFYESDRQLAFNKLEENARSLLVGKKAFFVFGYSQTIVGAFKKLVESYPKGSKELDRFYEDTKIFIGLCDNKNRYNSRGELEYCDGVEYAKMLINETKSSSKQFLKNVKIVPDAVISFLMMKKIMKHKETIGIEKVQTDFSEEANPNLIDAILLGVNGLDINDNIFGHTAGHLNISKLAYDYNIPVYIFADTWKIGKLTPNQELYRESRLLPQEQMDELQKLNVEIFNPREDVVELNPQKISGTRLIITDKGIFPVNWISADLESNFPSLKRTSQE